MPKSRILMPRLSTLGVAALTVLIASAAPHADEPKIGQKVERKGDEIVVCGQLFHTTTPVVLWLDPGGYDAYRVERRFSALKEASWKATEEAKVLKSPNRFSMRTKGLSAEQIERVRGGGWDLDTLRGVVDQFVVHFDARGTSKGCFQVLHDQRGLSVHFMLDIDGTIYQTLDLKESAWHATIANGRSVGIEIANVGAYAVSGTQGDEVFSKWYKKGPDGKTHLTVPNGLENSGLRDRTTDFRPIRDVPVVGEVQGQTLKQYDLTPQQYESLTKLTATLCTIFPKIKCDYPRDKDGKLALKKLVGEDYTSYEGILGHYHVQTNKVDPGPAFQWDRLIDGARKLMAK